MRERGMEYFSAFASVELGQRREELPDLQGFFHEPQWLPALINGCTRLDLTCSHLQPGRVVNLQGFIFHIY